MILNNVLTLSTTIYYILYTSNIQLIIHITFIQSFKKEKAMKNPLNIYVTNFTILQLIKMPGPILHKFIQFQIRYYKVC